MHTKRITLRDVAQRLGVSHTTVAMALRSHHSISAKRQEQVRQVAEEMGYRPDPLLSSLAAYRQLTAPAKLRSTAAWVNYWQNPGQQKIIEKLEYRSGIWRGACEMADRFGYHLDKIQWEPDISPKRFEQILIARGIRGVLIPPHPENPDWAGIDWSKFSVVRFGLSVPAPDSNLVTPDQFRAAVMAVERIHEYGYKRVGLVIGEQYNRTLGGNTLGGFLYAQDLLKQKVVIPVLKTQHGLDKSIDKLAFKKWLSRYSPDAILTSDAEIPAMLSELGYSIPQDIAVAGTTIYDIPVDTGIDQHSEAIGRIAMETLVKQLNVNELGEPADPVRILVESRWRDGKTLPRRR